jgi:hypothetical protein
MAKSEFLTRYENTYRAQISVPTLKSHQIPGYVKVVCGYAECVEACNGLELLKLNDHLRLISDSRNTLISIPDPKVAVKIPALIRSVS